MRGMFLWREQDRDRRSRGMNVKRRALTRGLGGTMRRRRLRVVTGGIALLTGLALAVGIAAAYADTVGISNSFGDSQSWHFDGVVDAGIAKCGANRPVRIFRRHDGPDVLIGKTKTEGDDTGEWVKEFGHIKRGLYYAKIRQGEGGHLCDGDASHAVRVDY